MRRRGGWTLIEQLWGCGSLDDDDGDGDGVEKRGDGERLLRDAF